MMKSRATLLTVIGTIAIVATGLISTVANAQSDNSAKRQAVIDYWTADRRAAAIPRDLRIDNRGLGYLRRPDGSLIPYGHQIEAESRAAPTPNARPGGGGNDTEPPVISTLDPAANTTIGTSHTFSAIVTDDSGLRSVSFIITYPDGVTTQTFSASNTQGDTWSTTLSGFTPGDWSWKVEAKDRAKKGGNTSESADTPFTVGGGGGGGGGDTVTNAVWSNGDDIQMGGDIQMAAGRLYYQMPSNPRRKRWGGYVCSGTVVVDGATGRSVILTASHCVYDDANKAFARNVLFIPNQAGTTGSSGTDSNCDNDPIGCWVAAYGVVDVEWTTRTFPDNIPWDYGFYVVDNDPGSHSSGFNNVSDTLDVATPAFTIDFNTPKVDDGTAGATTPDFTHALGYSYSDDPNFMYCAEDMTTEGDANWWLPSCGLSGGSSGGSWIQPMGNGAGPVISVNSWGYTSSPGMAGPKLSGTSAFSNTTTFPVNPANPANPADGDAGYAICCP